MTVESAGLKGSRHWYEIINLVCLTGDLTQYGLTTQSEIITFLTIGALSSVSPYQLPNTRGQQNKLVLNFKKKNVINNYNYCLFTLSMDMYTILSLVYIAHHNDSLWLGVFPPLFMMAADSSEDFEPFTLITQEGEGGRGILGHLKASKEWIKGKHAGVRPWAEFFNVKKISRPQGAGGATRRVFYNIKHYQSNYLFVFLGLVIYCMWVWSEGGGEDVREGERMWWEGERMWGRRRGCDGKGRRWGGRGRGCEGGGEDVRGGGEDEEGRQSK